MQSLNHVGPVLCFLRQGISPCLCVGGRPGLLPAVCCVSAAAGGGTPESGCQTADWAVLCTLRSAPRPFPPPLYLIPAAASADTQWRGTGGAAEQPARISGRGQLAVWVEVGAVAGGLQQALSGDTQGSRKSGGQQLSAAEWIDRPVSNQVKIRSRLPGGVGSC